MDISSNEANVIFEFHAILDEELYIANFDKKGGGKDFVAFCTKDDFQYTPLCDDFGPMNISSVVRFIEILEEEKELHPNKKLVYLVDQGRRPFTNGAFLTGAYLILKLDFEPGEVLKKFDGVNPQSFEPFRDATFAPVDFGLSLLDCWRALRKAKSLGWLRPPSCPRIWGEINIDEYDHYEDPLNGDLVQVRRGTFAATHPEEDPVRGGGESRRRRSAAAMFATHSSGPAAAAAFRRRLFAAGFSPWPNFRAPARWCRASSSPSRDRRTLAARCTATTAATAGPADPATPDSNPRS